MTEIKYFSAVAMIQQAIEKLENGVISDDMYTQKMAIIKKTYELSEEEFYDYQDYALTELNRKKNIVVKKYSDWKGSLTEFLEVGDYIDEDIKNHFINVLPPKTFRSNIIQMGEPYSCDNDGRNTYMTITKDSNGWKYVGICRAGEKEQA